MNSWATVVFVNHHGNIKTQAVNDLVLHWYLKQYVLLCIAICTTCQYVVNSWTQLMVNQWSFYVNVSQTYSLFLSNVALPVCLCFLLCYNASITPRRIHFLWNSRQNRWKWYDWSRKIGKTFECLGNNRMEKSENECYQIYTNVNKRLTITTNALSSIRMAYKCLRIWCEYDSLANFRSNLFLIFATPIAQPRIFTNTYERQVRSLQISGKLHS